MARTVEDVALLLSVMAGPDPRVPIAITEPGSKFAVPLERDFQGVRIAWSGDFGGLPIDARIAATFAAQRATFAGLGCTVADGQPDFSGADEVFKGWRAWNSEAGARAAAGGTPSRDQRDDPARGRGGPAADRAAPGATGDDPHLIYHRVREFMATHEFMVFPTTQVPPFPIEQRYITEINGVAMGSYIEWMRSCYYITITGLPAISVPCGFTPEGLPVGLQIVGVTRTKLLRACNWPTPSSGRPVSGSGDPTSPPDGREARAAMLGGAARIVCTVILGDGASASSRRCRVSRMGRRENGRLSSRCDPPRVWARGPGLGVPWSAWNGLGLAVPGLGFLLLLALGGDGPWWTLGYAALIAGVAVVGAYVGALGEGRAGGGMVGGGPQGRW